MCPCELKPYENSHKLEQQQIDSQNHTLGNYVRYAILSTIGNSAWFKPKSVQAFEYPEKAFLQQEIIEKEKINNENPESQEEIAVYEMKKRINLLKKQGLPESPM